MHYAIENSNGTVPASTPAVLAQGYMELVDAIGEDRTEATDF